MNSVQDIILESEYNVLMALSEYYEKQIMFETVIMEAGATTITPERISPNNENLIQRFIEWCHKMVANIKSKFNKVPPRTPVPPPLVKPTQTVVRATQQYSQAATQNSDNDQQVIQQMNEINSQVASVQVQQDTNQQTQQNQGPAELQVEVLQNAANQVQQTINQVDANIQQMNDIASQAQDATKNEKKQRKLEAEKAKLKTGSTLLKKIKDLIDSVSGTISPANNIEGDPMPDPAIYFQKATEDIKKATNYDDLSDIWNNVIKEKRAAIEWYKSKSEDNKTPANERKFCQNKMKIVEQWYRGYADTAKQLSDAFVDQIRNNQNGGGAQNTNEPAPEQQPQQQQPQQNGRRISPEAQNILNDINGGQNPPQQSTQQQKQNNPQPTQQPAPQQQKQNNPPQQNPTPEQQPQPAPQNNQQQNPTPEQQPQQQTQNGQQQNVGTNNANGISGAQLFDLINNNLARNGHRRRWNMKTQLLEFSTTGGFISDSEGNVYPYATEPYQVRVNTINPQLFDVVGKGGLDNSTIIVPAKFNDHGDLLSKGSIKQEGDTSTQTNGAQPTQNNPQPTQQQQNPQPTPQPQPQPAPQQNQQQNPAPEQQAQNGQPQQAPQQQQQNNANNSGTINGEQLVYTAENIVKTAGRMQFSPGLSAINPNQLEMWSESGYGEGGKIYVIDKDTCLVYPILKMNNLPMKPAMRFSRSPFDINVRVFDIDTPFTPAKVDNLQDKNIIQRGSFG